MHPHVSTHEYSTTAVTAATAAASFLPTQLLTDGALAPPPCSYSCWPCLKETGWVQQAVSSAHLVCFKQAEAAEGDSGRAGGQREELGEGALAPPSPQPVLPARQVRR